MAHARYENLEGQKALRSGGDCLVPADAVIAHLQKLSAAGVGYKSVAIASDVPAVLLYRIKAGKRTELRQSQQARILAVDQHARAAGALVPAGPTRSLIQHLVAMGYSRSQLARWMGYKQPALDYRGKSVSVKTAARIEILYRKIQRGLLARKQ
jgi:hypothetical protein